MRTHRYRLTLFAAVLLAIALFTGCAKTSGTGTPPPPPHAGAVNAFDSGMYDALYTAQQAIEQASVGVTPAKKPFVNQARADYTIAEKLYKAYHTAAVSGTATQAQQTALQNQVMKLQVSLGSIK